MTSHRDTFNTYELIALRNVYLDDNNIDKAIRMESIVVEGIVKCNINQIRMKYTFNVPKFNANLLSVCKFEGPIQPKQMHCKSCDGEVIAIVLC